MMLCHLSSLIRNAQKFRKSVVIMRFNNNSRLQQIMIIY